MKTLKDIHNRLIRFTRERLKHIQTEHPEMSGQIEKISETLLNPDRIVKSWTDSEAELFYRNYDATPVTKKFLCVVVKVLTDDFSL